MKFEDIPWKKIVTDNETFTVFEDGFPVTEGHLLFVPKHDTPDCLSECYKCAYLTGVYWVEQGYCDSYNIGQNIGKEAGQTVMWPHIHLIPRRKGDMDDPRGGVRHVIPEKGNYKKSLNNT